MLRDAPLVARLGQNRTNRVDEAQLLIETVLKLDPQSTEAQDLLKKLKSYKRQQGQVGQATNSVARLEKPKRTGPLTGAQAEALAEQLANAKAKALYNCQPFRKGTPATFVQGRWVWHDLRGQGSSDVEATVKFAADGTNPEVAVILLDSRLISQLPPP